MQCLLFRIVLQTCNLCDFSNVFDGRAGAAAVAALFLHDPSSGSPPTRRSGNDTAMRSHMPGRALPEARSGAARTSSVSRSSSSAVQRGRFGPPPLVKPRQRASTPPAVRPLPSRAAMARQSLLAPKSPTMVRSRSSSLDVQGRVLAPVPARNAFQRDSTAPAVRLVPRAAAARAQKSARTDLPCRPAASTTAHSSLYSRSRRQSSSGVQKEGGAHVMRSASCVSEAATCVASWCAFRARRATGASWGPGSRGRQRLDGVEGISQIA